MNSGSPQKYPKKQIQSARKFTRHLQEHNRTFIYLNLFAPPEHNNLVMVQHNNLKMVRPTLHLSSKHSPDFPQNFSIIFIPDLVYFSVNHVLTTSPSHAIPSELKFKLFQIPTIILGRAEAEKKVSLSVGSRFAGKTFHSGKKGLNQTY